MLRKVIWLRGQTSALFASVSCLVSSRQSFRTVSLRSGLPFQLVAWCLYVLAVISDNNWSLSQLSCFYRKIAGEVAIFFILYQNVISQHSFNPFFVRIYHIHMVLLCLVFGVSSLSCVILVVVILLCQYHSQVIRWEDSSRNDLLWDVKTVLTHSLSAQFYCTRFFTTYKPRAGSGSCGFLLE